MPLDNYAAIDIGSNAGRLYIAGVSDTDSRQRPVEQSYIRVPIRLGEDVFLNGVISKERVDTLISTLQAFQDLMKVYQPVAYRACATSAMREAKNQDEIINRVRKETGIELEVINGSEEAAIIRDIWHWEQDGAKTHVFVDVGGGSSEIAVIKNKEIVKATSFDLGTIRLLHDKVQEDVWGQIKDWLKDIRKSRNTVSLSGAGGNVVKLATLYGNDKADAISYENLKKGYRKLKRMSFEERVEKLKLRPDRADVIVPAARIILFIMKTSGCKRILVPRLGIVDGIIAGLIEKNSGHSNS